MLYRALDFTAPGYHANDKAGMLHSHFLAFKIQLQRADVEMACSEFKALVDHCECDLDIIKVRTGIDKASVLEAQLCILGGASPHTSTN